MSEKYEDRLESLVDWCNAKPCTPLMAQARIRALALMNLKWDSYQVVRNLPEHPHAIAERLVAEAFDQIRSWDAALFAEADEKSFRTGRAEAMEDMHEGLFQTLWTIYDIEAYRADRIARYEHRIDVNGIRQHIEGGDCIDFGCGHGNFAHAMLNRGAKRVLGLDFGEDSLRYAEKMRDLLGVGPDRITFKRATVYETGEREAAFDFAVQNGVFHHLEDEDRAYREVHRVLKRGGWFWIYSVGAGAITHILYDGSRRALQNIPPEYIVAHLKQMNLATGKVYQLGDSMVAIYRFTTWEDLTSRLQAIGFGNFRRLVGGCAGDFDHDAIAADTFGKEKFGAGDLRLVCQKVD